MPRRPNVGEVGNPDAGSVQGGNVGTQAQNEAAVNAVMGGLLSMGTPLGPLGPMAINAATGSNLGKGGFLSAALGLLSAGNSNSLGGMGISGHEGIGVGAPGGLSAAGVGAAGYGAGNVGHSATGPNSIGGGYGGPGSSDGGFGGFGGMSDSAGLGIGIGADSIGISEGFGGLGMGGISADGFGSSESGDGGGGGGGGTVICTELHRQGRLEQDLYELDEAFGAVLALTDPLALAGYQRWARPVVRVMQRSRRFSALVAVLARPWVLQMAHEMGRGKGSSIGCLMMRAGLPLCRLLAPKPQLAHQ